MTRAALIVLGLAGMVSLPAGAQSLAARVGEVREGIVRFNYASRPDVCGNGTNSIRTGDDTFVGHSDGDDRDCPCEFGPVRVSLVVGEGTVNRVRVAVGSKHRDNSTNPVDLGTVSTSEASNYLLDLARRSRTHAGGEAIFAVTLADSVNPWPDLIRIARNDDIRRDTRKQAVFWLGQAAGDVAGEGLTELAEDESEDRDVRESAVFALSQLGNDQGIPALIRIVRTNRDPKIRRTALFWLGQSDDPRALDLFEELLANN
jgi:HEAT repeats/PBS lyase HEAT-like repeat